MITEEEITELQRQQKLYLTHMGAFFRTKRREAGLTQQQVADRVGRTKVWVSDLELGRNDSHTSAWLYAHALGIDLPYVSAMANLMLKGEERFGSLQTA